MRNEYKLVKNSNGSVEYYANGNLQAIYFHPDLLITQVKELHATESDYVVYDDTFGEILCERSDEDVNVSGLINLFY